MIHNISNMPGRITGNTVPEMDKRPIITRPDAPSTGPANGPTAGPAVLHGSSGALAGAIEHMVQQGMPIDIKHIVAVKNAIADGQYPVNPILIAEKVVQMETLGELI